MIENVPEGSYSLDYQLVVERFSVENGSECQVVVTDAFGDGIFDGGFLEVTYPGQDGMDEVLRVEGSEIQARAEVTFTVSSTR